jgi:ABC-type oligopeptide transport system ATPase subunit
VVEHISETVLVLHRGRIVESGQASEVLQNPQDPYTRELLSAVPRLERSAP